MKYCNSKNRKRVINEIVYESDDESDDESDNCCFRCGREGHYVSSCYALNHINGYRLK
jgi:hypothetical protein